MNLQIPNSATFSKNIFSTKTFYFKAIFCYFLLGYLPALFSQHDVGHRTNANSDDNLLTSEYTVCNANSTGAYIGVIGHRYDIGGGNNRRYKSW